MRTQFAKFLCATLLIAAALAFACQSGLAPPVVPADSSIAAPAASHPAIRGRSAAFSSERAWQDLRALTEIGPRPVGSEGNARARTYLREELEKLNLEVDLKNVPVSGGAIADADDADNAELQITNLSAVIPGTKSSDLIVLVAHYDTQAFEDFDFVGANDGGSGVAVVLELARVITADPLPYATQIVFLDGDAHIELPDSEGVKIEGFGSFALARSLAETGVSSIRLMVILNQVGDADLRIARDLMSHRIYREAFWKSAARLGRTGAFPPDSRFESPTAFQSVFLQIGLRQIVSIIDPSFGGEEPPGLYANTEQDSLERCSSESLETVGVVVLESLDAISERLFKIDRFAAFPVTESSLVDDPSQAPKAGEPESGEPAGP